ncbi:MAG: Gfo/Idh/MocA family oxidoreductase [Acidobacteria bacterium]|nr:Gfo/Idh/MocA family oxidoreductase [Acidobacteriota bacterium]
MPPTRNGAITSLAPPKIGGRAKDRDESSSEALGTVPDHGTKTPDVAVLGCGSWGKNLVRNFHELGALRVVCDTSERGRLAAQANAPGCTILSDPEAVFASPVPSIVIATPAETHYSLACHALESGKDVFVEKPLALTYPEGLKLSNLARSSGRILMVGHVLEYHPGILRLRELVAEGELGRIQYIYSNRLSLGTIRREENILWSFAPHDIAVILRLVGQMPFEVVACGGAYVSPNTADVTVTNLLFDNGVRAHIFVSWLHPFKEQRLVVVGSRKMASFDDISKKLIIYDQHVEWRTGHPIPVKNAGAEIRFPSDEPLRRECLAFLQSVRTRRQPLTDGRSAVAVLKVLGAAQRSLITNGQGVSLPMAAHA